MAVRHLLRDSNVSQQYLQIRPPPQRRGCCVESRQSESRRSDTTATARLELRTGMVERGFRLYPTRNEWGKLGEHRNRCTLVFSSVFDLLRCPQSYGVPWLCFLYMVYTVPLHFIASVVSSYSALSSSLPIFHFLAGSSSRWKTSTVAVRCRTSVRFMGVRGESSYKY